MEQALGSRYVIGERLGGGGMGTVYRAKRRDGGPDRAVKLLRPELAEDPVVLTRFVQERTLLLKMRSDHLVTVEDMIVDGDTVAIVMELVAGGTLRRHALDSGPMSALTALRLTRQVLVGLDVVHANGVVHRDVKPENVLLDRPEQSKDVVAKVSDFGIARLVDSPHLTGTFNYIGTPHYCAPEIANGATATPAVDVYAAGVMLYELVAGTTPFAGLAPYAVIKRQMEQAAPRSPLIPEALWWVLMRWLTADPAARPPDARQAMLEVDDLLAVMTGTTISLPGAVPTQAKPLASQPGQVPLRAPGLAAAGAGGSALAGSPPPPGFAAPPVPDDYLEVIHTPPPGVPQQPQEAPEAWPRQWPSQRGYDGTPPFGLPTDHPSIVPGFAPTPPPSDGYTPPPQAVPEQAPAWDVDTGAGTVRIRRSKGLVIGAVAVVVIGGATGTVVAVSSSGGGSGGHAGLATTPAAAATLRFPAENFPELGVTENRTWAVSGGQHPMLHGTLVFHTTKNVLAQINELLPKSLVSNVSKVTFKPQPKVIKADPVVQYTLPTQAGQTVTETYDISIASSDVSMAAMQRWAAEQIAQTGDVYREAHKVLSMGIAPKVVSVPVGGQLQLQLVGKQADGTAAPSVAFGGATFTSANPAVATVSKTGAVTGVAAGTTKVVAKLGTLSATVPVTVSEALAPTQAPQFSTGPSQPPGPTQATVAPTTVPPTIIVDPGTVTPPVTPPVTLPVTPPVTPPDTPPVTLPVTPPVTPPDTPPVSPPGTPPVPPPSPTALPPGP